MRICDRCESRKDVVTEYWCDYRNDRYHYDLCVECRNALTMFLTAKIRPEKPEKDQ